MEKIKQQYQKQDNKNDWTSIDWKIIENKNNINSIIFVGEVEEISKRHKKTFFMKWIISSSNTEESNEEIIYKYINDELSFVPKYIETLVAERNRYLIFEYIHDSITFHEWIDKYKCLFQTIGGDEFLSIVVQIIFNLYLLFVKKKIIHEDFHWDNIILEKKNKSILFSYNDIIDDDSIVQFYGNFKIYFCDFQCSRKEDDERECHLLFYDRVYKMIDFLFQFILELKKEIKDIFKEIMECCIKIIDMIRKKKENDYFIEIDDKTRRKHKKDGHYFFLILSIILKLRNSQGFFLFFHHYNNRKKKNALKI